MHSSKIGTASAAVILVLGTQHVTRLARRVQKDIKDAHEELTKLSAELESAKTQLDLHLQVRQFFGKTPALTHFHHL